MYCTNSLNTCNHQKHLKSQHQSSSAYYTVIVLLLLGMWSNCYIVVGLSLNQPHKSDGHTHSMGFEVGKLNFSVWTAILDFSQVAQENVLHSCTLHTSAQCYTPIKILQPIAARITSLLTLLP